MTEIILQGSTLDIIHEQYESESMITTIQTNIYEMDTNKKLEGCTIMSEIPQLILLKLFNIAQMKNKTIYHDKCQRDILELG